MNTYPVLLPFPSYLVRAACRGWYTTPINPVSTRTDFYFYNGDQLAVLAVWQMNNSWINVLLYNFKTNQIFTYDFQCDLFTIWNVYLKPIKGSDLVLFGIK